MAAVVVAEDWGGSGERLETLPWPIWEWTRPSHGRAPRQDHPDAAKPLTYAARQPSRAAGGRDSKRLDGLMKAGKLADALDLFYRTPRKNVVAWTLAVSGLTRGGRPVEGLDKFADMVASGVAPNDFACNAALAACAATGTLRAGEHVHSLAVRSGWGRVAGELLGRALFAVRLPARGRRMSSSTPRSFGMLMRRRLPRC